MPTIAIIVILFIAGSFIVGAARAPFVSECGRGWWRGVVFLGSGLIIVAVTGFCGAGLVALGAIPLPASFEWPVGRVGGVFTTSEGLHVVPHAPTGRIQVYDVNWRFLRGWQVDASGGVFDLAVPTPERVEVFTARGQRHCVFGIDGHLISDGSYQIGAPNTIRGKGETVTVPTPLWAWVFCHPFLSWGAILMGALLLNWEHKNRQRRSPR
jgi:hypothetical protein